MKPFMMAMVFAVALGSPVWAQIHGTPASVTSLGPHGQPSPAAAPASVLSQTPFNIFPGPPASVTSLGPLGFQNLNPFFPFRSRFSGRRSGRFAASGRMGVGVGAFPIVVPYYTPAPAYPLLYPIMPVPGGSEDQPEEETLSGSSRANTYGADPYGEDAVPPVPRRRIASAPAAVAPPEAAPAAAPEPEQPPTVLVFRDGHRMEVHNYAIVGRELYNLGDGPRKVALADLDLPATVKLNDDRGVEFQLPVKE